jgi:UDP-glucuronate 4-epimerase
MAKILITGSVGFIGFHLSKKLLERGEDVVGIDNLNDYYDVNLKKSRLEILNDYKNYTHINEAIENRTVIEEIFRSNKPNKVVNLAAQAGVRYSIENPHAYVDSNIVGFVNILEGCRHNDVEHFVFASSSSVYGANTKMPFSVHDNVDHPVSLYAASKKANELMAHSYSHLYNLPCTGLRFFTVYGPWGRPDMALSLFAKSIFDDKPINVFNHGKMKRDFTYIDDIIEGVTRALDQNAQPNPTWSGEIPDPATSYSSYKIYNIGNNSQIELTRYIEVLEETIGKKAIKNMLPMQAGDVPATYANIDDLIKDTGFRPNTPIEEGIIEFVRWYREYYVY